MKEISGAYHYKWQELAIDAPLELLERRRIAGKRMMLAQVELKRGCHVATHAHESEQLACVLSGRMRFGLGAEGSPERREVVVQGGEVLHLPSNVPHSADALEDSVVLDVFSPVVDSTGIDRKS